MWFLYFLLFCFIIFFVIPGITVGVKLFRLRRQVKDFFKSATSGDGFNHYYNESAQQQNNTPRKKIDPSVGEYVEFTEISHTRITTEPDGSSQTSFHAESQIIDVEWEDI